MIQIVQTFVREVVALRPAHVNLVKVLMVVNIWRILDVTEVFVVYPVVKFIDIPIISWALGFLAEGS